MPAELRVARARLTALGHRDPIDWTLHIPLTVWRRKLIGVLSIIAGRVVPEWRTMYGNLAGIEGERAPDVKVRRRSDPLPDGPFLSSSDATFPVIVKMLRGRFPAPSPYEVAA